VRIVVIVGCSVAVIVVVAIGASTTSALAPLKHHFEHCLFGQLVRRRILIDRQELAAAEPAEPRCRFWYHHCRHRALSSLEIALNGRSAGSVRRATETVAAVALAHLAIGHSNARINERIGKAKAMCHVLRVAAVVEAAAKRTAHGRVVSTLWRRCRSGTHTVFYAEEAWTAG
jgi:hypothetical protein